jgi:hypothetical protein
MMGPSRHIREPAVRECQKDYEYIEGCSFRTVASQKVGAIRQQNAASRVIAWLATGERRAGWQLLRTKIKRSNLSASNLFHKWHFEKIPGWLLLRFPRSIITSSSGTGPVCGMSPPSYRHQSAANGCY